MFADYEPKRLQNMTEEEWLSMSQDSRERKREMLKELKVAAESWKNSPYGYLWIKEGMRRQPTANEINLCEKQTMEAVSAPVPPAR